MGVGMERWCPTQQMLGVFLRKGEKATSNWNYCAADGNVGIGAAKKPPLLLRLCES
jgi:hypothetical protein